LLAFKENTKTLTLGVEMEIQVLDTTTLQLTPKTPEILERCSDKRIMKEMFQSTLEIVTGVCDDAHQAGEELNNSLEEVKNAAVPFQVCFAGTATHPMADYNDRIVTATPRYHQLLDRNQWLIRRMAVYGLHVHLGMANGDECMRYNNFFLHQVPLLISLSASSPYWNGRDTGLVVSCQQTHSL
jgi:carboxylate-amine ligase